MQNCSGIWSKNATRLKEHTENCNAETEPVQTQRTKRKKQQTLDGGLPV
jgi:hypothetical protein